MDKKYLLRYPLIIIGSVLMAVSVKCVYNPVGLVTGGFSGLAIIAEHVWKIPLWITNVVLNLPLFIAAFFTLGRGKVVRSLVATVAYSVSVGFLPDKNIFGGDMVLVCITGGLLMGVGIGLILSQDSTSGGVDMISVLIYKFSSKIPVVWVMFAIDAVIISIGVFVFGVVKAAYAIISVFIVSYLSGKIIDGPHYARAVMIISKKKTEISERIMSEIDRGVTGIPSVGMYTGSQDMMLLCIASRHEVAKIRDIVGEVDSNAFMSICDVSEVFGEGFVKNIH